METNEIMVNEEVNETTEEIANTTSEKGFNIAAGIGLAGLIALAGYGVYKVAKPIVAKIKAKKDERKVTVIEVDRVDDDSEESEEI